MASLQATTESAGTGFTLDLRTAKLVHKDPQLNQNRTGILKVVAHRMIKALTFHFSASRA